MEVRRSEAADARGKTPSSADLERVFMGAVEDRHRPYRRLPPMPGVVPPPPPPSKCVIYLYKCKPFVASYAGWRTVCGRPCEPERYPLPTHTVL